MKEYLTWFMKACSYSRRDMAFLLASYETLQENTQAASAWQELLDTYEADILCDFGALLSKVRPIAEVLRIHIYTMELLFLLCLSRHTKKMYAEKGLSEELFLHTMLDLRYKLEECREVSGTCGTFVAGWFAGFFHMTRFAFGRLQFEILPFGKTYSRNGKTLTEDSPVINMHIPRTGTPLTPASCDEAFRLAAAFFRPQLGEHPVVFVCHSWLLYPPQREFLPPHSNLIPFMNRFEIIEWKDYEGHPHLWRIFDRMYDGNPEHLPYDTSLRKAYVDRIKQGGKTGEGYGLFFYSDE